MCDFVNYKKRDVSLPEGCKDLADVLNRKPPPVDQKLTCGKLSEIAEYVTRVWESQAPDLLLCFAPGKELDFTFERLTFWFQRVSGGLQARIQIQMGTPVETALRHFLQRHGFQVPDHSVPAHFSSKLPVLMICEISPLPADPLELSALATELFTEVCVLREDSDLTFFYYEPGA